MTMTTPSDANSQPNEPMPTASLKTNVAFAAAGSAFFTLAQFVVVVLIANFASQEILGTFQAGICWTTPVVMFLMLQLRGVYIADAKSKFTFGTYYQLRKQCMMIAGLIVIGFAAYHKFTSDNTLFPLLLLSAGFGRIVNAIGDVHWGVFQRCERLSLLAKMYFWRGTTMILPFAVFVIGAFLAVRFGWLPQEKLAIGTILAAIVYVFLWAIVVARFDRPKALALTQLDHTTNQQAIWKLAKKASPLGIIVLIISLCENVPMIVIQLSGKGGEQKLGIFSAMFYLTLPLTLLIVAMTTAASGRISQYFHENKRQLTILTAKLTLFTIAIGLATILATHLIGQPVLRLIYRNEPGYAEYPHEFILTMIGGSILLLASLFGTIVTYTGKFWIQVPIQLAVLAATATTAFLLIPNDPIAGGAWSLIVRASTQAGLYGIVLCVTLMKRPWQP